MSVSDKRAVRCAIRAAIAGLDPAARAREEALLRERLRTCLQEFAQARSGYILAYLPLPDEPDLLPLLREWAAAGRLCLPQILADGSLAIRHVRDLDSGLADGPFGVREPATACPLLRPQEVACVIVPGRAFTPTGDRLGRGKGYYDRLLASFDRASAPAAASTHLPDACGACDVAGVAGIAAGAGAMRAAAGGGVLTVAPVFDCQILSALPTEAHDQRVRIVLSALRRFGG